MMALLLAIAAFVIAAVAIIQSDGKNLAAWGVLCLAVVLLMGRL